MSQKSTYGAGSAEDSDQELKRLRIQLKRIAITDKPFVYEMYLRYNSDHKGYLDKENMRGLCEKMNLHVSDEVLSTLVRQCTKDKDGHIYLEDFRRFVEEPN